MKPGRPSAIITVGGRALSAAEAALVSLRVMLANGTHHWAEVAVWPRSKFATAKAGDSLSIALGTVDSEEDVLSGEVTSVSQTPGAVIIEGLGATATLSRSRRSETYVGQTVADIVRDLAGAAAVDEIEADLKLEAYSVDDRRTVWRHLNELAWLSGAEVGSSAAGGLRFLPIRSGAATRSFRHGAELLGWALASGRAADSPGVAPHGAASEAGQQKWHWLLRDPLGIPDKPSRVVGAFHSRDAAGKLGEALEARAKRAALGGRLLLVGESKIRPGEIVGVSDLPGSYPGPLRVLEVRHALNAGGYTTSLTVEAGGAVAAGPTL